MVRHSVFVPGLRDRAGLRGCVKPMELCTCAVSLIGLKICGTHSSYRTLAELNAGCRVAKLFAKHFKIEEQIEVLKKRVNIAAGTPNR